MCQLNKSIHILEENEKKKKDRRDEKTHEKIVFHFIIAHQASVCTHYLRLSSINAFVASAELFFHC